MFTVTVTTQAELDAALADDSRTLIVINSPKGVWLRLSASDSATVQASGSATVRASGSATVQAFDSATVRASDSATVQASGSATVRASGSATVEAFDSATVRAFDSATVQAFDSATVRASGSATVRAFDSATVRASGSATVQAFDSATVRAFDSATVRASGSATVRAFDSATVRAFDSATVRAASHVAVHLHSAAATISGGAVIDITSLDLTNPATWASYHGVEVADGEAILFKAVGPNMMTGQNYGAPTVWAVGQTTTAPDWADSLTCGYGLHASPRPAQARSFRPDGEATRFLRVAAPIGSLRPLGGNKVKAPAFRVLAEVDVHGRDIEVAQ